MSRYPHFYKIEYMPTQPLKNNILQENNNELIMYNTGLNNILYL